MDTENIYGKLLAEGACNTVVPLMFDLDYCMKGAGRSDGPGQRKACKKKVKRAARKEWAALRKELDGLAEQAGRGTGGEIRGDEAGAPPPVQADGTASPGETGCVRTQEEELLKLAAAHPGRVLPFYVVDPAAPATGCMVRTGR